MNDEQRAALVTHDIDAMLNAVHPRARVDRMDVGGDGLWVAGVVWWRTPSHDYTDPDMPWDQRPALGCGPTRTEAIADACRKAMEGAEQ